ncbi:Co2+/Mg2+ efflux protein ApaG [Mariprofundus erugo]|uniref:Protein ApaG n=1 Tax=Mariprofundus erugo TaxID=2528639 RepID=A0A5R9GLL3_9PROT|nr:Co2+/Mg2+ efflux protein ApaG [Mariprofundus erugo]TLS76421.1 Co2+/Mg2+ efflux protein ApaG [Mariprofundus erugo]
MSAGVRVEVHVKPEYAEVHSDPGNRRYLFIYHVSIYNAGTVSVQLLSRYWQISDADGRVEEVQGDGVVGQQPVIAAGQAFYYHSFCVLETPVGCMQGSYRMSRPDDGEVFDVPIAAFTLAVPGSLN